ncbi:MAG: peptidoglycan DD-metalloendopeptidase family protein [Ruminococcus sp.]|nr:peptidoglycan DD-metalloendopeptidase family protein [Ruminococcus sp.]
MKKHTLVKRAAACLTAFMIASGAVGSSLRHTVARADDDHYDDTEYYYGEPGEFDDYDESSDDSSDDSSEGEYYGDPDDINEPLYGFDVSAYAERLKEIDELEQQADEDMSAAESAIQDEKDKQKAIVEKIQLIDEKISVTNQYITALEIEINTNRRQLEQLEWEIKDTVETFKKRLRALYIAGNDTYMTVLFESDSFYDVLMRMELIQRVAEHDDKLINDLYAMRDEHEAVKQQLDAEQQEYNKQINDLAQERAELSELYMTSEETLAMLEEREAEIETDRAAFILEKEQYETDLSDILKAPTGTTSMDEEVAATMVLADIKLSELREWINIRIKNGEVLRDDEPTYTFAWPAPGAYNITSGVGARWGSYHKGIDIMGDHGMDIVASDSGTVIRINTDCPHDYGKTTSCGCGGGYGNYVIIDHGNEFITLYGHMCQVDVEVGDVVKQGDVIGHMGSTGFSTGDHVHFEIRYQGFIVNPAYYVDVSRMTLHNDASLKEERKKNDE